MYGSAFLALVWPPSDAAQRQAESFTARLAREGGWRAAGGATWTSVWTSTEGLLPVRALPDDRGLIIGDLFSMPGVGQDFAARHCQAASMAPVALARDLSRRRWGRYVAILGGAEVNGVYRDPSGHLQALTWPLDEGLVVVASDLRRVPVWLRPRQMSLNWDAIAAYVAAPSAASSRSLFDGVEAVTPGSLQTIIGASTPPVAIWRPAAFAGGATADLAEVKAALVACVDNCTTALVDGYDHLLVELSGGLDSAVLAGALAETGQARNVACWLNWAGAHAEGDEAVYARAVTDRLGVDLTTVTASVRPLDEETLAELGDTFQPALSGADPGRDRETVARLAAPGSWGIVSGQGGDAVFFQMPSILVAADEIGRLGWRAVASPVVANVARRLRLSVWEVMRQALAARRPASVLALGVSPLATAALREWAAHLDHPWMADAGELSPAKRLQVRAIASAQVTRGESRRARCADLIYPLVAQPVVELCLSIPAPVLAAGEQDRSFARAAFAGRLPDLIRRRRSKGELGAYFARLVAASADVLRPHLLDGVLCASGLLDRRAVEAALDPAQLIWAPDSAAVLSAATVESWVRHWQGRLPDSDQAPRQRELSSPDARPGMQKPA